MSDGCTDCGRKGGCDHRKGEMFAAIDEALAVLYPSKRWDERDDAAALGQGVTSAQAEALADRTASRLETVALLKAGGADDCCDYVYALCFGRVPSILQAREGAVTTDEVWTESAGDLDGVIEEIHLRVALSALAPFAAVQQVAVRMERRGAEIVISEVPRTGVFDPILLPRYQRLAAVLAELNIRNLDFGDLTQPPEGFEAGTYHQRFLGAPSVANYLFFAAPASAVSTTVLFAGPTATAVPEGRTLESP